MSLIRNFESPVSYAAFTKDVNLPRVVDNEATAKKITQLVNISYDSLSEKLALVNGLKELSCLSHWNSVYHDADIPFGIWGRSGVSRKCFDIVGTHSRVFSDENSEVLHEMFVLYECLKPKDKKWLQAILERLQKSKRQQTTENKILDLGIAAEMLLLKDLNESDPVSFPFRFRGSWLLGNDFSSRKKMYDTLKLLYSYRCVVAHDGTFKDKDVRIAHQKLPEFYNIVEKILQIAIRSDYPRDSNGWLELMLGSETLF